MAGTSVTRAFDELSKLVQAQHHQDLTDSALLERFARDRDEAAFSVLMRRHGPTVLGVCRRVLRHEQDAEDAFQAAFLVLARKAGSLRRRDSAGAWLFQVAYRLALKMKANSVRRQTVPVSVDTLAAPAPPSGTAAVIAALDVELSRLPDKYRMAVILCHTEGLTRAEAAKQLGWKAGAVKIRLERAVALFRDRLARRGLACGAVAMLLKGNVATAAPPAGLAETTLSASTAFAQGTVPASAAHATALAQGVLRTMTMIKFKIVGVAGALLLLIGISAGLLSHRVLASRPDALQDDVATPSTVEQPAKPVFAAPAKPAPKPLRVLLFAGGPTREYQFVRRLFVNKVAKNAAELSVCVQDGGGIGLDLPPERILKGFPELQNQADDAPAEKKYGNLHSYDVVIAFDPDWTMLNKEQIAGLARWVKDHRGGLVFVAGQINTYQLARRSSREHLKPLLDLLPVVVEDSRVAGLGIERVPGPRRLQFADAAKKVAFLNLDGQTDDPLAAWEHFFVGGLPKQADPKRFLIRGFENQYPIESVKHGAVVLATVADRGDPPFLVTGKATRGGQCSLPGETCGGCGYSMSRITNISGMVWHNTLPTLQCRAS